MTSTSEDTATAVRRRLEDLNVAVTQLLRENTSLRRTAGSPPDNRPKLTRGDVKRIHEMKRNGCTVMDIAACLDVHHATISRTLRGIYNK